MKMSHAVKVLYHYTALESRVKTALIGFLQAFFKRLIAAHASNQTLFCVYKTEGESYE